MFICSKNKKKSFLVEVYKEIEILVYYKGSSPEEVWESVGILKKYGGELFALNSVPNGLDRIGTLAIRSGLNSDSIQ
jgi:hypothetical protein